MTEASIETCLRHHQSRFLQVRADFLAICDGDETMAKLLRILESWTDHRRAAWYQEYVKAQVCQQRLPAQEPWLWITMSHAQFSAETLSTVASEHTIKKALCRLLAKGYIERRLPPDEPYGRYQYRLCLDVIQQALDQLLADKTPAWSVPLTPCDEWRHASTLPSAHPATAQAPALHKAYEGRREEARESKHAGEGCNSEEVRGKHAEARGIILLPSQKQEILCTTEMQRVSQHEGTLTAVPSPPISTPTVDYESDRADLAMRATSARPISPQAIQAMTGEVASILGLPVCPALRRIVEDFGAVEGLSLLGEADAAREYILDQRRNRTQQAMSPAFFRRWLKREQEAMQQRAVAYQQRLIVPVPCAISSDAATPSRSSTFGVYPSLMNLEDRYRQDMERSVMHLRQQTACLNNLM